MAQQRLHAGQIDRLPVTFLSDYGYADEFAGVCRAVVGWIAPESAIVDIGHGVPRQDVRRGALQLAEALPFAAPGVHLAVVDPGVGTDRLPVAVRARDEARLFVGPDNGLLSPALEVFGGAAAAVDLTNSRYLLDPVSVTFHGRDIFAPVAGHLATGVALEEVGEAIDPSRLTRLALPRPEVVPDRLVAHVLRIDAFGNATLDATEADLAAARLAGALTLAVKVKASTVEVRLARTFADVEPGRFLLYTGSGGRLAVGMNLGDAAHSLGLSADEEVTITLPA